MAESLYDSGVRRYICGMALGCDMYFAEAVLELAERRGGVLLEAAIPCLGQDERWGEAQRARYARLLARCGRRTVLSHRYTPGCMEARNLYMVEQSHWLVAAYNGSRGGTFNTIRLALRAWSGDYRALHIIQRRRPFTGGAFWCIISRQRLIRRVL